MTPKSRVAARNGGRLSTREAGGEGLIRHSPDVSAVTPGGRAPPV